MDGGDANDVIEEDGTEDICSNFITFRMEKGTGAKLSWDRSQISICYYGRTATKCPCEDINFEDKIRVGRFKGKGDGRRLCVHCKAVRSERIFFHYHSDLRRHAKDGEYMKSKGPTPILKTARELSGAKWKSRE